MRKDCQIAFVIRHLIVKSIFLKSIFSSASFPASLLITWNVLPLWGYTYRSHLELWYDNDNNRERRDWQRFSASVEVVRVDMERMTHSDFTCSNPSTFFWFSAHVSTWSLDSDSRCQIDIVVSCRLVAFSHLGHIDVNGQSEDTNTQTNHLPKPLSCESS